MRRLTRTILTALGLVAVFSAMEACAADPKPRNTLTDASVENEGDKNAQRVTLSGVQGSTLTPNTGVVISEGDDTTPARMNMSKPGSTTTAWIAPLDTWLDAAGIVRVEGATATITPDGATTFGAAKIEIDNKATLEGAALYAQAVERYLTAASADQREAFKTFWDANKDIIKSVSPPLFEMLRAVIAAAGI